MTKIRNEPLLLVEIFDKLLRRFCPCEGALIYVDRLKISQNLKLIFSFTDRILFSKNSTKFRKYEKEENGGFNEKLSKP